MPAETATLAPPCPGPLNVLCGELRGDSSDESMGCYSPRSMNAAKLLLSASRANIGIRKGMGSPASRASSARSKSMDGSSVPFKLTPPTVASTAPYPSVAAAAAAAVQEAMHTVLATRQCFVVAPPQPKRRASGSRPPPLAAGRARASSCPELQQDAADLLASLQQVPQPPLPPPQQQHQPSAAPAFGFRFGQASTGALAPEKALLPSLSPPVDSHAQASEGLAALALTAHASERSSEHASERSEASYDGDMDL